MAATSFSGQQPATSSHKWSHDDLQLRKAVGISLAVGGNLLISGALNVQKYVHNQNAELKRPYTRLPLWWLGFGMTILGELGNFAAYGFAEASLVTPLGAVSVVANAFIAAIVLREGLRAQDLLGCALVVCGSAIIALTTSLHEESLDPDGFMSLVSAPSFLVFSGVLACLIAVVYALRERYGRKHVVYYVFLCSLIGSITVMSAKGLSSFFNSWAYGGAPPFRHPTAYVLTAVLLVTAVLQVKYLNMAMMHFGTRLIYGNTETVPVFFVCFALCTITASSVLYRDFENESAQQIVAFASGCLVTFAGVKLITSNRQRTRDLDTPFTLQIVTAGGGSPPEPGGAPACAEEMVAAAPEAASTGASPQHRRATVANPAHRPTEVLAQPHSQAQAQSAVHSAHSAQHHSFVGSQAEVKGLTLPNGLLVLSASMLAEDMVAYASAHPSAHSVAQCEPRAEALGTAPLHASGSAASHPAAISVQATAIEPGSSSSMSSLLRAPTAQGMRERLIGDEQGVDADGSDRLPPTQKDKDRAKPK